MDKDARVGYAEREQAIDRLQHHCSLGRLGLDELAERTARAQAASTRGELDALLADLPDEEPRPSRRTSPAWRTHAMVAALFTAALTGLWFLTRDPTPGSTDEGLGYWWPLWIALVWSMLLVLHYLVALGRVRLTPPRDLLASLGLTDAHRTDGGSRDGSAADTSDAAPLPAPADPVRVPPGLTALTAREREVFVLVAKACSNQEIARRLTISERAARTHVSNILLKLGLSSRTEAALVAVQAGLTPPTGRTDRPSPPAGH
jgi:DNA-binding CsgD family transcriptional regulator